MKRSLSIGLGVKMFLRAVYFMAFNQDCVLWDATLRGWQHCVCRRHSPEGRDPAGSRVCPARTAFHLSHGRGWVVPAREAKPFSCAHPQHSKPTAFASKSIYSSADLLFQVNNNKKLILGLNYFSDSR